MDGPAKPFRNRLGRYTGRLWEKQPASNHRHDDDEPDEKDSTFHRSTPFELVQRGERVKGDVFGFHRSAPRARCQQG
jgi:hypothetical protein